MEKYGDYFFASGFLYLYLCLYKSPCQQVMEMKGIKKENAGKSETPLYGVYAVACS